MSLISEDMGCTWQALFSVAVTVYYAQSTPLHSGYEMVAVLWSLPPTGK